MTFARWTGATWQTFSTYNRWNGSAWTAIAQARRWNGSSWVNFGFLSATLSPVGVSGSRATAGTAVSNACTTTPINGSGSYTYVWQLVQGVGNTVTAATPNAAATTFQATVNGANDLATATATCQVTDTASGLVVVTSNSCSITLSYTGP